jgi:3-mercaptopyruvate sulfurtransferase SseA
VSESLPPLIEPADLASAPSAGVRVIHVADAAPFAQAHLPGASLVEPRSLVSGQQPAPGRLPSRARLEALF